jgi:hypothetical protein
MAFVSLPAKTFAPKHLSTPTRGGSQLDARGGQNISDVDAPQQDGVRMLVQAQG